MAGGCQGPAVSGRRQKQYWKNWSTRDDLRSLTAWQRLFGSASCGLLVFAYDVIGDQSPVAEHQLFAYHEKLYGFVGIELAQYAACAHPISKAWDTLAIPTKRFRSLAAPVEEFFLRTTPIESNELENFSLAELT